MIAIGWAAVAITAISGLLVERSVVRRQSMDLVRNAMQGIVLSAESTRSSVGAMNANGDFDRAALLAEARKSTDFHTTRLYGTIPIVAAWRSVQNVADQQGYEFRIPSNEPRNPKNAPAADEKKILDTLLATRQDYFGVDQARNQMVYARSVTLTKDCLPCHGDPATSLTKDGKDPVGFPMEGWHEGEVHGAFLLRAGLDQVDHQVRAGMERTALWLIPIACLIGFGAFLAARRVKAPLAEAVRALQRVSQGDLSEVSLMHNNDEIGDMTMAVQHMSASLRGTIHDLSSGVGVLSASSEALLASAGEMASGARHASDKSHSVAAAAEQMSSNAASVAASMEQTTTNLANVASATEQMTATIGEIAGNSEKARRIAEDATRHAARITEQMNQLGEAAREIGKVTETITEISSQTNLLALNATIEAARAGSAGKGFAVVANEIKALAHQAAGATEDIKSRIAGVQSATAGGIAEIEQVSRVIDGVSGIVASIAAAIEEQAAATKGIAGNIAEASFGLTDANKRVSETSQVSREIARDIIDVDRAAGEMASGSDHVRSSAEELSKVAEMLTLTTARFRVGESRR
jgi:methyl-accepting chemotaxis protein